MASKLSLKVVIVARAAWCPETFARDCISIVSGPLTKNIGSLVPDLMDEIQYTVDQLWGKEEKDFKAICVYDLMSRIIGQATNRVFVGLPLCRDPALLDAVNSFSLDIPISSTLLQFFWRPLRPLVAPIITLPNRIHTNRSLRILKPEIQCRLKNYVFQSAENMDVGKEEAADAPRDFLQWSIDQAKSQDDPYFGKIETLAGRVLLNNFTSITHPRSPLPT